MRTSAAFLSHSYTEFFTILSFLSIFLSTENSAYEFVTVCVCLLVCCYCHRRRRRRLCSYFYFFPVSLKNSSVVFFGALHLTIDGRSFDMWKFPYHTMHFRTRFSVQPTKSSLFAVHTYIELFAQTNNLFTSFFISAFLLLLYV